MDKSELVSQLIPHCTPAKEVASRFAPANIALIKYWGKRDRILNCPMTSSLSLSLADKGAMTSVQQSLIGRDEVILNNQNISPNDPFYIRLSNYLSLFRPSPHYYFQVNTVSTVPIASGLASSACGFAALILALNDFFDWQLADNQLSILARIGSGSACRSLWHGFVLWRKGERADGLDSYAERLTIEWPEIRFGIILNAQGEKKIPSTAGMLHTQKTSPFYSLWPETVARDLDTVQTALVKKAFTVLGETAEANAEAMHALMQSARPAIHYSNAATLAVIANVQACRQEGIEVYFTQDAGPHIKLLFLAENESIIRERFTNCEVISPFK